MNQHEAFREQARAFAEAEVAGSVVVRDRAAAWGEGLLRAMGAAGLLGLVLPRAYGGAEGSAEALCGAMAGFGEGGGDAGLALAWGAHTLACAVPIVMLGSEAQRRRHLPGLCSGERIGGWAYDDGPGAPTRATRCADGWVLEGRKLRVVNAPIAALFVVSAITREGRSTFLVERDTPGLSIGSRMTSSGMRTATIAEVVLERCEVPEQALLAPEGAGLATVRLVQRWERGCMLAPWLGLLRAALAQTVGFARDHHELGVPLAHSQALRARLADLRIRLELCERLQARAAWQLDHRAEHADRDLAVARLFVGESVTAIVRDAAELCAPQALELGHAIERLVRDAPLAGLLGVRPDLLRSSIAGSLLGLG